MRHLVAWARGCCYLDAGNTRQALLDARTAMAYATAAPAVSAPKAPDTCSGTASVAAPRCTAQPASATGMHKTQEGAAAEAGKIAIMGSKQQQQQCMWWPALLLAGRCYAAMEDWAQAVVHLAQVGASPMTCLHPCSLWNMEKWSLVLAKTLARTFSKNGESCCSLDTAITPLCFPTGGHWYSLILLCALVCTAGSTSKPGATSRGCQGVDLPYQNEALPDVPCCSYPASFKWCNQASHISHTSHISHISHRSHRSSPLSRVVPPQQISKQPCICSA